MSIIENLSNYVIENIEYVQHLLDNNYAIFLLIYILTVSLILLFPLPSSSILVLTGIFFNEVSYFINYLILNISCLITYLLFQYLSLNKYTNISLVNNYISNHKSEITSISKTINFAIGRVLIPYSIFSYCCGYLRLDFKKYILGNMLGVIPRTIIISSFSIGVRNLKLNNDNIFIELINDPYIILSGCALICLYIFRLIYKYNRSI